MVERVISDISVMAVQSMGKDAGDRSVHEGRSRGKSQSAKEGPSVRAANSDAGRAELPAETENLLEMPMIGREYRVDKELGKVLIKLYDKETGETIREVPPEEIVKLGQKMKRLSGILLDKKV